MLPTVLQDTRLLSWPVQVMAADRRQWDLKLTQTASAFHLDTAEVLEENALKLVHMVRSCTFMHSHALQCPTKAKLV